jgi:hypothetical protein
MVQKNCDSLANVAIVTTQWAEDMKYRRQQQERQERFNREWKEWIRKGRNIHQYSGDPEHAAAIIRSLLKNNERIQKVKGEIEMEKLISTSSRTMSDQKAASILKSKLADGSKVSHLSNEEREARLRILNCYDSSTNLVELLLSLFGISSSK